MPSTWFELDPVKNPSVPSLSHHFRQLRHLPQWLFSKSRRRSDATLRPTAYLDGLRGFAALLVFILHNEVWARGGSIVLENAFGYEDQYHFVTLPFVRPFFSGGHLAVPVLFVISGYVLSSKPISLIHRADRAKLTESLASSLFRRWFRLYLPVAATTFISMTLNHFIHNLTFREPEPNYIDEVTKWISELKSFSFLFGQNFLPWLSYNYHTWTIPLEYKGSIIIYTSLTIFATLSKNARLLYQMGLVFYFLYIVDAWWAACFVAGMLLCDLDLLAQAKQLPSFFTIFEKRKRTVFALLFICGMYLGGIPTEGNDMEALQKSPGWYYLSYLKPAVCSAPKSFFLTVASVMIVASVSHLSWLKKFFELSFIQHLGRVSYAFYLVHGPILDSVGDRVYAAVGWTRPAQADAIPQWMDLFPLPRWGPYGMEFSFFAAQLFLFPFTLWIANLATTLFDEPAIDLGFRMHKWATTPSGSPASIETELILHNPQREQLVM
jgi:peptidoglycan/LPS O-acetylase OafA/YrhL